MRSTVTMLALAALLFAGPGAMASDDAEERAAASRQVVKAFAGALKGELQQAIEAGGPPNAIEVCNRVAPGIAEDQGERRGWEVGRTSLKLRNPDNSPDAWEREVLMSFEARKAEGEDVTKLEHYAFVEQEGRQIFRYMKAIPTGDVCLACHGSELSPEVTAALAELYPQDQATGFQPGDIRGAFTITQLVTQ